MLKRAKVWVLGIARCTLFVEGYLFRNVRYCITWEEYQFDDLSCWKLAKYNRTEHVGWKEVMPVLYVYNIYSPLSHLHVCFQQRFWFSLGRMKMCYLTKWEDKPEWYKYIQLLCHLDFEKFDWTWALWSSVELYKITMVSMKSPWQHSYFTLNPFKKKYPSINTQQSIKWQVISFFCMFRLDIFWFISIIYPVFYRGFVDQELSLFHSKLRWTSFVKMIQTRKATTRAAIGSWMSLESPSSLRNSQRFQELVPQEQWMVMNFHIPYKKLCFLFFHIQVPNILSVCFILGWMDVTMVISWCFSLGIATIGVSAVRMWGEKGCFCFVDPLIETPSLKSTNMLSQPKRIELWMKVCLGCKRQIKV